MTHVRARIFAIASFVVIVSGCGGPPAPSSAQAGHSEAAVSSADSAPPSSSAVPAQGTAGSSGGPTVAPVTSSHADPSLEALLPAAVTGTAMQRSSATLAALLASGGGDRTAIDAFLAGLGKTETDGSFAAAFDPTGTLGGGIFVFRIAGVDAGVLMPAIVSVEQSDLGPGATTRRASVAGKPVTVVSVGSGVNDTEWVYGRDDVVFVVHAADEPHAAAFLQALR